MNNKFNNVWIKSVHVFPYKIPIKLRGTKININDEAYETGQNGEWWVPVSSLKNFTAKFYGTVNFVMVIVSVVEKN